RLLKLADVIDHKSPDRLVSLAVHFRMKRHIKRIVLNGWRYKRAHLLRAGRAGDVWAVSCEVSVRPLQEFVGNLQIARRNKSIVHGFFSGERTADSVCWSRHSVNRCCEGVAEYSAAAHVKPR